MLNTGNCPIINDDGNNKEVCGRRQDGEIPESQQTTQIWKINTISLNMQEFLSRSSNVEELIGRVEKLVLRDLKKEYPDVDYFDEDDLTGILSIKKYGTHSALNMFDEFSMISPGPLASYVGVNYNKKTKEHECIIEEYHK